MPPRSLTALQVSQHKQCVLRVTIMEESGGPKGDDGHKVRAGRGAVAPQEEALAVSSGGAGGGFHVVQMV